MCGAEVLVSLVVVNTKGGIEKVGDTQIENLEDQWTINCSLPQHSSFHYSKEAFS